jgi:hypothetical protein
MLVQMATFQMWAFGSFGRFREKAWSGRQTKALNVITIRERSGGDWLQPTFSN